jgi:anaphase-promoting complex subunit 2
MTHIQHPRCFAFCRSERRTGDYITVSSTMTSTTTASRPLVVSNEPERWKQGSQEASRINAVRSRKSTLAAKEFFSAPDSKDWRSLPRRLGRLCQVLEGWDADNGSLEMSCSFSEDPKESRRLAMTASIMANADSTFFSSFQTLFRRSLLPRQAQFDAAVGTTEDENMTTTTAINNNSNNSTDEEERVLFDNLRTLGWIRREGMLQQPLGEALHQTILNWVRSTIANEFEEENMYAQVQSYKTIVVEPWLGDLVGLSALEQDNWSRRLDFCIAECYCLVRMDEIFELVAEYPDSHAAVIELRTVLELTKMHQQLGKALRESLIRRLNHPGANTSQIIDVYINTIKVGAVNNC